MACSYGKTDEMKGMKGLALISFYQKK